MSSQHRVLDLILGAQAASGLGVRALAAKSGLSHGTIGNYLKGQLPEHLSDDRLQQISRAWGIPFPRLKSAHLADLGVQPASGKEPTKAQDDVILAILADDRLLPEAKQHLVNQYGLLLRVQAASTASDQPPTITGEDRSADQALGAEARKRARRTARK